MIDLWDNATAGPVILPVMGSGETLSLSVSPDVVPALGTITFDSTLITFDSTTHTFDEAA